MTSATATKCNLNQASKEDLVQIEGVGEKTAEEIIRYRESQGGFKDVDELDNIGSIAKTMLDKIKPHVEGNSGVYGEGLLPFGG
jgi:competence protein ComEA